MLNLIRLNMKKTPIVDEDLSEEAYEEEYPPELKGVLYKKPKAVHFNIVLQIFLLWFFVSSLFWYSPESKDLLWASYETVFVKHEYWRLITSLFAHSDLKHILGNTPLFLIFGWYLRSYFGILAFPMAALLVGVLANITTLSFYEPQVRVVGASGIVYGLVGMWITFYVHYEKRYSFLMRIFRVTGVSLVLLFPTTYSSTTSYLAHGAGFVLGIIAAIVLINSKKYE